MKGLIRGTKRPPRVVLYGPPGVGKSTFGADAPAPVFLATEDGVDNLPVDQFPVARTWAEVLENARRVAEENHDFKTLVLDTLNGAAELASQHVCATVYGGQWTAKGGNGGFMAWGQGWKATSEEFRKLLVLLDSCRANGMTIALLAHVGLVNVRHPVAGDFSKYAPDIDKSVWARVAGWTDIILRADYEYVVTETRTGKGKVIGTQTRIMFSQGDAACDAKTRVGYELPDQMPLSWDEFAQHLGAKDATLTELRALWSVLDPGEAKKTLAWLGVERLEDADMAKARKLLNRLRQKKSETVASDEKGAA